MLELKRWLREFKEEAPWYFWVWAIPTAILAPFNKHVSVTALILLALTASSFFLKKLNLLRCHYLYLLVVISTFVTQYPVRIRFFKFLDNKGITDSIFFDLLRPYSYILFTFLTVILELIIIYAICKLNKINNDFFLKISLCATMMTMANVMVIYIIFFAFLVFTSFL